jgi:hypothetical protein
LSLPLFAVFACLTATSSTATLRAAEVDESKVPPPAQKQIDFVQDIRPILESSCLRCHGPVRPKSGFRLDNRASSLKGGDNGIDILPGNSAKSPFIHYVAGLVPDMEMPPPGKGEPLSKQKISVLRAWIDQGLSWENAEPTNAFELTLAPTLGYTFVDGDKHKFRENVWRRDGWDGGLQQSELFQQLDRDTSLTISGHAFLDNYQISLDVTRNELGFIHAGWQQYRKYYDDTGGIYPPSLPFPQSLGPDLHLDIGKAWIDFGLTLPQWPRMVLGYEYDYKRGQEATTTWGSDRAADARNIAPNSKHLDEGTHVIKFDFDADLKGLAIEDRFRGEFYNSSTRYTNLASRASVAQNVHDDNSYFQGANSFRLEKKFNGWLLGSGGYFYSKLNGEDSFADTTTAGGTLYPANAHVTLERESHIFNLNGLVGPFSGLSAYAAVQSEWTHEEGSGGGNLNAIAYTRPPGSNLAIDLATLASNYRQNTISESTGLRFTAIPFTSLFADARLRQETLDQSDSDIQSSGSFIEEPSFNSRLLDVRGGFNTSPWEWAGLSAHYRRYEDDSHYKTNEPPQPIGGYPGFIRYRELITDEIEAKLSLRPCEWLKTALSYQYVTTDYRQNNRPGYTPGPPPATYSPGGDILAGKYDSHIYSLGAAFTPQGRFYFSGTFSYQDTRTSTASAGLVPPYEGDVYSVLASATCLLSQNVDLLLSYSFSLGDFAQSSSPINPNSPPIVGIKYQEHAVHAALCRRIGKYVSTSLQYSFYYYDEPSTAGANNYKAQTVSAALTYHFH